MIYRVTTLIFLALVLGLTNTHSLHAYAKADLPDRSDIKKTRTQPIDGVWRISTIDKRIKIEAGRAYAIDSWKHLGIYKIERNMVVIKDIKKNAAGNYKGYDLPLLGQWNAILQANRNLKVTVGFVSYELIPVDIKSISKLQKEMRLAGLVETDNETDSEEDWSDSEEESEDEESYAEDDDYSEEDEDYSDDGYRDDDDDQFEEEDQFSEDDEYDEEDWDDEESDEDYDDEQFDEEEAPTKVKATIEGPLRVGCVGKQNYKSGNACWSCPAGYKRYSLTRKMGHDKACKKRAWSDLPKKSPKYRKAKKLWEPSSGCPSGQFGHMNKCKSCPEGTKRMHIAGFDNGYCKYID